ncbi:MAG: hypothetical protein P4N59_07820 [Negativicutes bacterium]|nr:hypothetical protein [Negativicutes bacterium]
MSQQGLAFGVDGMSAKHPYAEHYTAWHMPEQSRHPKPGDPDEGKYN